MECSREKLRIVLNGRQENQGTDEYWQQNRGNVPDEAEMASACRDLKDTV